MAAAERHVRRDLEPTIPADLLDLSDEEFRRLGHWVVDRTARHLATLRERPAITTGEIGDLDAQIGASFMFYRRRSARSPWLRRR